MRGAPGNRFGIVLAKCHPALLQTVGEHADYRKPLFEQLGLFVQRVVEIAHNNASGQKSQGSRSGSP